MEKLFLTKINYISDQTGVCLSSILLRIDWGNGTVESFCCNVSRKMFIVAKFCKSFECCSQAGVGQGKAPPHGPKVSKMVNNFGLVLPITIWNGL